MVPLKTAYARVVSGEIPILFDYDFNAMRAQYTDGVDARFVLPAEGTVSFPYIMGLVADAPNPENGRRVLDWTLSDEGQRIRATAFLRPVHPAAMPPEVAARFLPASEVCPRACDRYSGHDRGAGRLREPLPGGGGRLILRLALLAPATAVLLAFFLLPLVRLMLAGLAAPDGGGDLSQAGTALRR